MERTPIREGGTPLVEVDILDAFNRTLLAYQEMYRNPPPPKPMVVPSWLPDLCRSKGYDLDQIARAYGFDGYQTPDMWA